MRLGTQNCTHVLIYSCCTWVARAMVLDSLGIASFLAMVAFLSVLVSNKSSYVTCLLVSRVYNFALRLLSVTTNDAVYIAKHFISLGL